MRLPSSIELVHEALNRHPAGHGIEFLCDCESTAIVICAGCGQPVFARLTPGTWCTHADALVQGLPWWWSS